MSLIVHADSLRRIGLVNARLHYSAEADIQITQTFDNTIGLYT